MLALVMPAVACAVAIPLGALLGGMPTNWVVAAPTVVGSLVLWGGLIWRAWRG
jgi:hypothetical protein